jgi:hypothetical protein
VRLLAVAALLGAAMLVFAAAAAAASAPTATTGPVTSVGATTATVAGSLNPNGTSTSWYVEYGTSTSYGSKTSSTNAGSGTSSVNVSSSLAGLTPGTTYHYRFVATSSAGTGLGADGLLTTSPAPEALTGNASTVTTTSATLNGSVNPNGRATTWYFEYGTSTSYGSKTTAKDAGSNTSPVTVSAAVTGLSVGRTYHFRLVATSDAGTSRGADQTFSTSAAPTVTTKPASEIKDTSAKLNGDVNPSGVATTWYIEYGTSTGYGSKTPVASAGSGTSPNSVSATVSGLAHGTAYHFRLVATNASGTSTGSDQTFTTTGPPVPKTGSATGVGTTTATLTGTLDPSGHSTSWHFEYGTSTAYGSKTSTRSAGSGTGARAVSEAVSGLTPGTTYHARLVASSSAGTSYGADVSFTTSGPVLTLAAAPTIVVYGKTSTLSGTVSTKTANQSVSVFAQKSGQSSFVAIASVLTDAGGAWRYAVKPSIGTVYKALFSGGASPVRTIGVRPAISLRGLSKQRFATRVAAAHSFAGRTVQLQRRSAGGRWPTIARARLNASGAAVFAPHLPRGSSTLRVAMSVNQAGLGYLGGVSARLTYRRR